jgi:hypothetical protein
MKREFTLNYLKRKTGQFEWWMQDDVICLYYKEWWRDEDFDRKMMEHQQVIWTYMNVRMRWYHFRDGMPIKFQCTGV